MRIYYRTWVTNLKEGPPVNALMKLQGLDGNVKKVGEAIAAGAYTVDEIQKKTEIPLASVQIALTILEVKGIIRRNHQGGFTMI